MIFKTAWSKCTLRVSDRSLESVKWKTKKLKETKLDNRKALNMSKQDEETRGCRFKNQQRRKIQQRREVAVRILRTYTYTHPVSNSGKSLWAT